jgi:RNA polymerase sigma-70 factor (ECF subfamily)
VNVRRAHTDWAPAGKGGAVSTPTPCDGPEVADRGDPWRRELAEIYRTHADFVLRIAGHLGVHDEGKDDVVHDVFLVAHRRLPDFDSARGTLRSWLYGITRRVVMHHQRDHARRARRLHAVPQPPNPPPPDEHVAQRRAADEVDAFLASLPEERRLVFALADIEGMSAVEVARALDTNLNTVYGRLRSARSAFAAWLRRLDEDGKDDDGRR